MSDTRSAELDRCVSELEQFQERFGLWLGSYLDARQRQSESLAPDLSLLLGHLRDFSIRPGKRLRPFLVVWGARSIDPGTAPEDILPIAAAAEMLHVFALAHDDVMDCSDVRRGLPTVHKLYESVHNQRGMRGSAEHFGFSGAILLGDLAFAISDSLIDSSGLTADRLSAVRRVWNVMREEVMQGQFLDVLASCSPEPASEDQIWSILSLKSGKYTLERPLHLGAAAAGASEAQMDLFTRFGIPLGRAFQIRDDILGLFGSANVTGKPADSDVREGKSTLLISYAYGAAGPEDRAALLGAWGNEGASEAQIEAVRRIVRETGAERYARSRAEDAAAEASAAVRQSALPDEARSVLLGLAAYVLSRSA